MFKSQFESQISRQERQVKSARAESSRKGFHRMLPFWLLVASLVRDAAMQLMQCPYYQYTGAHFADLGRMTGCQPPGVNLVANGTRIQDPRIQSHHPNHEANTRRAEILNWCHLIL